MLLIFAILLQFACATLVSAQGNTFDDCSQSSDCRQDLYCIKVFPTYLTLCPGKRSGCRCQPLSVDRTIKCESHLDDCPRGEGCAKYYHLSFCVSCLALQKPIANLRPFNKKVCQSTPSPFPSPTPSPKPPNHRLDFCSDTQTCVESLRCLSDQRYPCFRSDVKCNCLSKYNNDPKCSSPSQCTSPKETCARNIITNATSCVSCKYLQQSVFHVPYLSDGSECPPISRNDFPNYPMSGNGFTLDFCKDDIQCQPGLKCTDGSDSKTCTNPSFSLCSCRNVQKGPQLCSQSEMRSCRKGEVCAKSRGTGISECISISVLYNDMQLPLPRYVFNATLTLHGSGRTGEWCKTDWDCDSNTRCRHMSEPAANGGCAGRRACSCEPLLRTPCTSNKDCRTREICVKHLDSYGDPFCLSSRIRRPYMVYPVGSSPSLPLNQGSGWAGDDCKSSDDCRPGRECRHITESFGSCNGSRRGCICKILKGARCSHNWQCAFKNSSELCVIIKDSLRTEGRCISKARLSREDYRNLFMVFSRGKLLPLPIGKA